jgi:hypothetical protein
MLPLASRSALRWRLYPGSKFQCDPSDSVAVACTTAGVTLSCIGGQIERMQPVDLNVVLVGINHDVEGIRRKIDDRRRIDADDGGIVVTLARQCRHRHRRAKILLQENGPGRRIERLDRVVFRHDIDDIVLTAGDLQAGNEERLSVDLFVEGDRSHELQAPDIGRR